MKREKRTYRSRIRAVATAHTRQAIIEAAVRLHAQGITELSAVAAEAGVSLPTVYNHFPRREELFKACIAHGRTIVPIPRLDQLASIRDPAARIVATVEEAYKFNEVIMGYAWLSYRLQDTSPALAQVVAEGEALIDRAVDVMLGDLRAGLADPNTVAGFARTLLNPLTYRVLRLIGGLDPRQAARQSAYAFACLLGIKLPDPAAAPQLA